MGLKEYDVEINGQHTTLQLSDEGAAELGLTKQASAAKESAPPANKEVKTPPNKGGRKPSAKQAEAAGQAFGAKNSG